MAANHRRGGSGRAFRMIAVVVPTTEAPTAARALSSSVTRKAPKIVGASCTTAFMVGPPGDGHYWMGVEHAADAGRLRCLAQHSAERVGIRPGPNPLSLQLPQAVVDPLAIGLVGVLLYPDPVVRGQVGCVHQPERTLVLRHKRGQDRLFGSRGIYLAVQHRVPALRAGVEQSSAPLPPLGHPS